MSKSHLKDLNKPPNGEPWFWFTEEMVASPAYWRLTLSARRVLDHLLIVHSRLGRAQNGNLPVSYDQFEAAGVSRSKVRDAIQLLEDVGFIDVRPGGKNRRNVFALTLYPLKDGTPASNRWRTYK